MKTVNATVENKLCISCGVCKGICPQNCISFRREHGMYYPAIDSDKCISCGLCADVCPGLGHEYSSKESASDTVTGEAIACFNAWSKDPTLRHVSASGGVVSTIVKTLLENGQYDAVFTLDTYDYCEQLKTRRYTADTFCCGWENSATPKSRYLPVSHEETVAYIKTHRTERLIIIGTSCAIRGIRFAVERLRIDKEQYLFIGLFCDKVFNYNVLHYFEDTHNHGNKLTALHFKNKESGGWPGDMKFFPENGRPFYVPLAERAKVKAYFMPERCLYCVDKLNICADISLGDNYTGKDESKLGSNSVIIRTEAGRCAWDIAMPGLEICACCLLSDIQNAQAVGMRLDNMYYGDLKTARSGVDLNCGVPREKTTADYQKAWASSMQKLSAGAVYDSDPMKLSKQIKRDSKKPNIIWRFFKRAIRYVKRKIINR